MSTELNLQAERAAFEAWAKTQGHDVVSRLETGGKFYVSSFTRHAWIIWQAARRTVAAPIGAEALPPLPKPAAYEPNGREPTAYTAEQVCQVVAPHVERIRVLERELAEARGMVPSQMKVPEQTIDTPEFWAAMTDWIAARGKSDSDAARAALITHIDGRTAGTRPPKHRDILGICDAYESGIGHGLQRDGHKSGDIFGNPAHGMAYELGYTEGERRAAAPSSLSGTEVAK